MLHERDVVYIALIIWCLIHTLSFWILGYLFKELLWIRLVAFFQVTMFGYCVFVKWGWDEQVCVTVMCVGCYLFLSFFQCLFILIARHEEKRRKKIAFGYLKELNWDGVVVAFYFLKIALADRIIKRSCN